MPKMIEPRDYYGPSRLLEVVSKPYKTERSVGTSRLAVLQCVCGNTFTRELKKLHNGTATTNCGCITNTERVNAILDRS